MNSTIYTNMDSVRNYNVFTKNSTNASKAMERATTGLKIVGAKDGTSQYAISEKMRERINSNNQASQNVQNGSALAKSADAGLGNTIDILKTLKARAINAANDTNTGDTTVTDGDRATIQKEIDSLLDQIDYNATSVQYNGKTLLNGTYDGEKVICDSKTAYFLSGKGTTAEQSKTLADAGYGGLTGTQTASLVISWTSGGKKYEFDDITTLTTGTALSAVMGFINTKATGVFEVTAAAAQDVVITTDATGETIKTTADGMVALAASNGKEGHFEDLQFQIINNSTGTTAYEGKFTEIQEGKDKADGESLNFQIGESADMSLELKIADMSAKGLGIQNLDVTTQKDAKYSIEAIDKALQTALEQQTSLGAMEQRLGYTADTLDTINENLQASDSAIRNSDLSKEITEYMKWNVLMQASQYMLAQSNQNAYSALNLLQ